MRRPCNRLDSSRVVAEPNGWRCRVQPPHVQLVVIAAARYLAVIRRPLEPAHLRMHRGVVSGVSSNTANPGMLWHSATFSAGSSYIPLAIPCVALETIAWQHGEAVMQCRAVTQRRAAHVARTSDRWPRSLDWKSSGARMSRCRMFRSREPLLSRWLLQAMTPTRARWPPIVRNLHVHMTHRCNF